MQSKLVYIRLKAWDHTNTYIKPHYTCRTVVFKNQDKLKYLFKRLERKSYKKERSLKLGGGWLFLPGNSDRMRSNGLSLHQGRFRLDIKIKKNINRKSGEALEQADKGGGGVTVPGGVQEMWH